MNGRYELDPSQRAHVWALAVCAALGGMRPRSVKQAAQIADEVLAELDERAKSGLFDRELPPP